MAPDKTFIYALVCPDTNQPRYIGKSDFPVKRLRSHLLDKRITKRRLWFSCLNKNGKIPILEILDEVPFHQRVFWEKHYISLYKGWGFNLLNHTDGGEGEQKAYGVSSKKGKPGKSPSVETREKLRVIRKGIKFDDFFGEEKSKEIKNKISERLSGLKKSEETKEKFRKAHVGKKTSEETKIKMSLNSSWRGKISPGAKKIKQFDLNGIFIKEWESIGLAAKSFSGLTSNISQCLSGKIKKAYGFKWVYSDGNR